MRWRVFTKLYCDNPFMMYWYVSQILMLYTLNLCLALSPLDRCWGLVFSEMHIHYVSFYKGGFNPWVGKIPWRREKLPIPVFWPGEFYELYSPWGHKELEMTEQLSLFFLKTEIISVSHQIFKYSIAFCVFLTVWEYPANMVPSGSEFFSV